jgi:hypothetical protein
LGKHLRAMMYGMLAAIALIAIPTSAFFPRTSKVETSLTDIAWIMLPAVALIGAIAGFVYSEWIAPDASKQDEDSPPAPKA